MYGNNEYYPDTVKWFSVKVSKEICDSQKTLDTAEYLEEEEIERLVEYAPSIQKKAFIGCMYESGARPEEFLSECVIFKDPFPYRLVFLLILDHLVN